MGDFFAFRYGGVLLKGPSADGTSGQVLETDGSGNLSFATVNTDETALTSGSVVFSDGTTLAEDNANFYWDSTNQRMGIGTTAPENPLVVTGAGGGSGSNLQDGFHLGADGSGNRRLEIVTGGGNPYIDFLNSNTSDRNARIILLNDGQLNIDNTSVSFTIQEGNFGVGGASPVAKCQVNGDVSSDVQFLLIAASSQTSNIFEIWNSSNSVLAGYDADGYAFTRLNSAPADASISASEAKYWFDDTNGSASFNVKAKQADGTVVTGSISLT